MMSNQGQPRGAFRYLTFGCRQTWVEESVAQMGAIPKTLGPPQAIALHNYLTDAGVLERGTHRLSETGQLLSLLKPGTLTMWQVIWTNWAWRSPLFSWWATVPNGEYSRDQCLDLLSRHLRGSAERSVRDALCALAGTLRDTPIGALLGQGIVKGVGRGWTILKTGSRSIAPWWAVYSASLLVPRGAPIFGNDNDCCNSVGEVLGVSDSSLVAAFGSLWRPDLFEVSKEGAGSVRITLAPDLTPERVLKTWIAQA